MSNEEADVPFWRRPLPPIPGPTSRLRTDLENHLAAAHAKEATSEPSEPIEVFNSGGMAPLVQRDGPPPGGVKVDDTPEPVEVQPVDFYRAAKLAEHALDVARAEARERRAATASARAAFAKALERWNHSQPIQTQEQALRDYVNQSNADRAARAARGQVVYHPGVTKTARAYQASGQRAGGGQSYRRGAVSAVEAMRIEAGKLRVAAAAATAKPRGQ
jgi:hypothetical protein